MDTKSTIILVLSCSVSPIRSRNHSHLLGPKRREKHVQQDSTKSSTYRTPQLNLAGHGNPASNGCQSNTNHIRYCQRKGIEVILSIGGSTKTYSLSSASDANFVAGSMTKNQVHVKKNIGYIKILDRVPLLLPHPKCFVIGLLTKDIILLGGVDI